MLALMTMNEQKSNIFSFSDKIRQVPE
uniref:Uncharacterized protein n=1 Tax=Rhizophora mucronata TaxID=61149 RepID=A0A2P2KG07_RHIMU